MQYNRISIDDPEKDRSIIKEQFIRELYGKDKNAIRNGKPNIFTIEEIWKESLDAFELNYVKNEIKKLSMKQDPDIEFINNVNSENIRLTDKGRKNYEIILNNGIDVAISKNPTIYQRLAKI
jgi:hypothetical protein